MFSFLKKNYFQLIKVFLPVLLFLLSFCFFISVLTNTSRNKPEDPTPINNPDDILSYLHESLSGFPQKIPVNPFGESNNRIQKFTDLSVIEVLYRNFFSKINEIIRQVKALPQLRFKNFSLNQDTFEDFEDDATNFNFEKIKSIVDLNFDSEKVGIDGVFVRSASFHLYFKLLQIDNTYQIEDQQLSLSHPFWYYLDLDDLNQHLTGYMQNKISSFSNNLQMPYG